MEFLKRFKQKAGPESISSYSIFEIDEDKVPKKVRSITDAHNMQDGFNLTDTEYELFVTAASIYLLNRRHPSDEKDEALKKQNSKRNVIVATLFDEFSDQPISVSPSLQDFYDIPRIQSPQIYAQRLTRIEEESAAIATIIIDERSGNDGKRAWLTNYIDQTSI